MKARRAGGLLTMAVAFVAIASSPPHNSSVSPCRVDGDTSTLALNVVQHALAASDSSGVLEPDDVQVLLVTDAMICQAIVNSYNAGRGGADSALRIESGFIVRAVTPPADTAYAMYLPAAASPVSRTEELSHFSKAFELLMIQNSLN